MTGNKSFSDARTCAHSVSFKNRTAFDLDFKMSVVAWKIRAFSTVCAKFRSRWCKRKYCESSVDATPSSKRHFNGASRSLAVADGQASLCRIRSACSNSTSDSESDCRRISNLHIALRQLLTSPNRCSNFAHRGSMPLMQCRRSHEVPQQQHLQPTTSDAGSGHHSKSNHSL